MSGLPPLPPGYTLAGTAPPAPPNPYPLKPLFDSGVVPTNGYRTPGDMQRLKAEGYSPAPNSLHLRGDAVDMVPGTSGMNLAQLYGRATAVASRWPGGKVLNEGDHIHVQLPGWGNAPGTPGTPNAGMPPLPPGYSLTQRGSLTGGNYQPSTSVHLTGQLHDGDTFQLTNGQNGRLFGADAYELNQSGERPDGTVVPLGIQARNFMGSQISPSLPVTFNGQSSYGRPIISLGTPGNDPAVSLLRNGYGLAEPDYLQGSPQFGPYMEAERLARLNRLGGFGTNAIPPDQFRHGGSPWATPEPGQWGHGVAVFNDEPTPFQGLRPDIAKGYLNLARTGSAADLMAYAQQNGFQISEKEAEQFVRNRDKGMQTDYSHVAYGPAPAPLINPGDGATGAVIRGLGDPLNMLDEVGGVVDSLGFPDWGGPRETIWNSDRRFGDILWNNIDQNRAILGYDQQFHPWARTGGQLGSALVIPGVGVEGVAARATEDALASGATRLAAEAAGKRAVTQRLALIGGGEGGAMGFGAGQGNPMQRLPGAIQGAAIGAVGGPILGKVADVAAPVVARGLGPVASFGRRAFTRLRGDTALGDGMFANAAPSPAEAAANAAAAIPRNGVPYIPPETLKAVNGGEALPTGVAARDYPDLQSVPAPAPGYTIAEPPSATVSSAAMDADRAPSVVSPDLRQRDYMNLGDVPPPPPGYTVTEPFGAARPMNERLSAEQMAALAEGVEPQSVLPRPANTVDSLSEAERANPSRFQLVDSPDEFDELPVRVVTTQNGGKVRIRAPLDLTQSLRLMGGIQDQGGELSHLGITNEPRRMDFGSNEQFLGRLINNETGMPLDEATFRLWEEGYLPEFHDRPTPADLVDLLKLEQMGQRRFHPEDQEFVQRFEAARSERSRIEQAANEGAPVAEDTSRPATLDDLLANTPPPSAYEDSPRIIGKVDNVNLDHIEHPEQIGQLIDQVSQRVGGFDAARRGAITNEETQRLAQEMGVKPEQILQRRQGQALNAEQLYAMRATVQGSRERVVKLAKQAVGGSDADKLAFRRAWLFHAALEEHLQGATAEAGRALQQFKMLARGSDANGAAVRDYLKGGFNGKSVDDAAQAIVDLSEDPARANRFIQDSAKPRWRDKLNELWVNSLLSGPKTHVVNFVGNALTTAWSLPEQALTAGIGAVTRSSDRATIGEVGSRVVGLADGAIEGLSRARRAFATGMPADAVSKVEAVNYHAIGGRTGQVIRTPTRALTAADEFWKSINSSAELHALAFRQATQEGRTGAEWQARYNQLLRNPTDEMVQQAKDAARYYTFQKELGASGKAIQQWANVTPGAKIILPFVRTPINLLKYATERSVLAPAMSEVRAAIRAGGRARDEALAKITLGSGISTAAVLGALSGRISGGGPSDPGERAALLQSGWQPYSIRIGNHWVSYARFDPFSTLIGAAADFAQAGRYATEREKDTFAIDLTMAVANNITNKTWLSGLSDFFNVLSDPDRYGPSWTRQLVASAAVPALLAQTEQGTDPYLRNAKTTLDAIKARIPYVAEHGVPALGIAPVPVRRDVWGDPVPRGNAVGPDILSPLAASEVSSDPLRQEMARVGAPLALPDRSLTIYGSKVPLTPQQYDDYVRLSGQPAKQYLSQVIRTPEWRTATDDERRAFVKQALSDARGVARQQLLAGHPELLGMAMPPPPAGYATQGSAPIPSPPPGYTLVH